MSFSDRSKRSPKRRRRGICWILAAAPLFCFAPSSHAAGPEDASTTDVEKLALDLYFQGNAAFKRGDFQEAREQYQSAWDLKPGYDIAGSLGSAEIKLRDYCRAAEHLAYALRTFPLSGDPTLRVNLNAMFAEARAEVASLKVEVTPADAKMTVDGAPVAASPEPGRAEVFVEAGARVVEVSREGYVSVSQEVLATKGGTSAVEVRLVPVAGKTIPERSMVPAAALGAAGGVALVGGIVLFAVGGGEYSTARDLKAQIAGQSGRCDPTTTGFEQKCDELADARSSANTLRGIGIGGIVVGTASLAAAGAYLAFWPAPSEPSSAAGLAITPLLSPKGGVLELTGTF